MNLVKSLVLCIGALLLIIGLQGVSSLWQNRQLIDATSYVVSTTNLSSTVRQLQQEFLELENHYLKVVGFVDPAQTQAGLDAFRAAKSSVEQRLVELSKNANESTSEQSKEIVDVVNDWLKMAENHLTREGVTELAAPFLLDAARQQFDGQVASLITQSSALATTTGDNAIVMAKRAADWTMGLLAVGLVLGLLFGTFSIRRLQREIGGDVAVVASIANAVANGDLTRKINTHKAHEQSVLAATARMQQSLIDTVSQVRTISAEVSESATKIAADSNDLCQRTEVQAVALEQTSKSMRALGETVKVTAEKAANASELAQQAETAAGQGGESISETIVTMDNVRESAENIVSITSIIDGIAFQTKLLALNAAVEAARAGEQGTGFAVVASEVQNLAHRTASAAQDIAELIAKSVERVESGSSLVNAAGETITDIVSKTSDVSSMMEYIKTASEQQNTGVVSVSETVLDLDRTTQKNAILAQHSAEASSNLQAQVQELTNAVSFFELDEVSEYISEDASEEIPQEALKRAA